MNNEKLNILIAEDEEDQRSRLKYVLESDGYIVSESETADRAIKLIGKNKYDMVITDMKMPGKNDGSDLLVAVKKISPETIVIIITAYGNVESAVRAMINGAYDYIQKPLRMPELRIKIERAFESRKEKNRFLQVKELGNEMGDMLKEFDDCKNRLKKINEITGKLLDEIGIADSNSNDPAPVLNEILNESNLK